MLRGFTLVKGKKIKKDELQRGRGWLKSADAAALSRIVKRCGSDAATCLWHCSCSASSRLWGLGPDTVNLLCRDTWNYRAEKKKKREQIHRAEVITWVIKWFKGFFLNHLTCDLVHWKTSLYSPFKGERYFVMIKRVRTLKENHYISSNRFNVEWQNKKLWTDFWLEPRFSNQSNQ